MTHHPHVHMIVPGMASARTASTGMRPDHFCLPVLVPPSCSGGYAGEARRHAQRRQAHVLRHRGGHHDNQHRQPGTANISGAVAAGPQLAPGSRAQSDARLSDDTDRPLALEEAVLSSLERLPSLSSNGCGTVLPTSRGFLPWRLSDTGPSVCGHRRRGPACENLHNSFREHLQQVRNSAGNFEKLSRTRQSVLARPGTLSDGAHSLLAATHSTMRRLPPEPRASASRFLARSKQSHAKRHPGNRDPPTELNGPRSTRHPPNRRHRMLARSTSVKAGGGGRASLVCSGSHSGL